MRSLLRRQDIEYDGKRVHLGWPEQPAPVYVVAEGPRTLELAGEIADGVIIGVGLQPELLRDAVAHVATGAARAGRGLAALDLWAFARVNVTEDVEAGIDEIRMELASCAHHVFRFTLEGKQVPADLAESILRVQRGYQPAQHEHAAGANADLMRDPVLRRYLAERFAVIGPNVQTCDEVAILIGDDRVHSNKIGLNGNCYLRRRLLRLLRWSAWR